MKTMRFLSAAAFAAIAFTFFACSSDDPDDNTGGGVVNLSNLPNEAKAVYLAQGRWTEADDIKEVYKSRTAFPGGGDVVLVIRSWKNWENEGIEVGRIENGKLSLSLPETSTIDEEVFEGFSLRCDYPEDYSACDKSKVSVVPENLSIYWDAALEVSINGGGSCRLYPMYIKQNEILTGADLVYFPVSGKVSGTETYTYIESGNTRSDNYDVDFSKGWSLYYNYRIGDIRTITTKLPAGATLEWWLECLD